MFNAQITKVNDLVSQAQSVAIVVDSDHATFDSMAAALALSLSLEKAKKKATVFSKTPPTVGLSSLVGINKVRQDSMQTGGSGLVISLPYKQGAIEKISYDIVGDKINLTVVPGPSGLDFTTEDITYQTPSETIDAIIAIGVAAEGGLSFDMQEAPLMNIDHNPANTGYGTVALVDERSSSNCELVAKILRELNLPIDADIAQNLLSGIIEKTDNFQDEHTSASAFELAGFLIQQGAVRRRTREVKDQFLAQEARIASQPQPRIQRNFRQMGKTTQTLQEPMKRPQTPKDWLEPRIYTGKTPVS